MLEAKPVTFNGLLAGVMVCTTPPAFDTVTVAVVAPAFGFVQLKPTVLLVTAPTTKLVAGNKVAFTTTALEALAIPIWLYAATV